jgi:hypothetical protein
LSISKLIPAPKCCAVRVSEEDWLGETWVKVNKNTFEL